jgi:hypothetical protein
MVTRKKQFIAYIDPSRMEMARAGGLKNFSALADESIERFIQNAPIIQFDNKRRKEEAL